LFSSLFFLLFLSLLDRMTHQNLSFITNINITGTRDERAQLVAKIVQYQKRLQKLRRDLMRRKYGERSLEKSSLAEKEEETEVVVQLTASSSNGSETKRNDSDDDALHLETIIEDEELRRLVDNSDDDDSGEENGGDRSTNNNGSNSKKKTKKTAVVFDRSLSAMPRLMKKTTTTTNSRSLDGDTREGRDSGGGVFDWLLDALDALDDKIAEKVECAEDALFDAFEDVQDSFKKTFSFRNKKKNNNEEEEKNDDDEDSAK